MASTKVWIVAAVLMAFAVTGALTECNDLESYCETYAKNGSCFGYLRRFMFLVCTKSCGYCIGDDLNPKIEGLVGRKGLMLRTALEKALKSKPNVEAKVESKDEEKHESSEQTTQA
ncbi:uncharacterized protein LOC135495946 [Lineus longissimus]|uniref:uncharacterized protein LOC135495946 n=1 Tax=Lineus longissimus TaxID=88925 RepID=UPI002B4F4DF9